MTTPEPVDTVLDELVKDCADRVSRSVRVTGPPNMETCEDLPDAFAYWKKDSLQTIIREAIGKALAGKEACPSPTRSLPQLARDCAAEIDGLLAKGSDMPKENWEIILDALEKAQALHLKFAQNHVQECMATSYQLTRDLQVELANAMKQREEMKTAEEDMFKKCLLAQERRDRYRKALERLEAMSVHEGPTPQLCYVETNKICREALADSVNAGDKENKS